jgi:hypothetical protein
VPRRPEPTAQQVIDALLDRAVRREVPIRKGFVQPGAGGAASPLATLVRHHDERALDLYLLILAGASSDAKTGAFDVTYSAMVWARALEVEAKNRAAAVSKVIGRLVGYDLIKRDRSGRLAHLTILREDGSGQDYTHPGLAEGRYLRLPVAYWRDGWDRRLPLTAKATLLIALGMPKVEFYLPIESAPKQWGISADTVQDGLAVLQREKLLSRRVETELMPLTARGYRDTYFYKLLPPLDRRPGGRRPPAAIGGNLGGTP